jgi:hypothetical protein
MIRQRPLPESARAQEKTAGGDGVGSNRRIEPAATQTAAERNPGSDIAI